MKEQLEKIKEEALRQIESSEALEKLNDIRVSYLGKKGELTNLLKSMKDVAPEDRPKVGQMVNDVRGLIEGRLEEARTALAKKAREEQLKREVIDVTLPARKNNVGHSHPNIIALEEVERIFVGMGYEVVEGPEVEYDRYNFEKLNIPKGSVLWICKSPYRPGHKRKNWYVDVSILDQVPRISEERMVRFETFCSGGKGGQHVNKVETGVRAIHIPTGTAVVSTQARSQHMNKQIAMNRLCCILAEMNARNQQKEKSLAWMEHARLERGNPVRIYEGMKFERSR